MESTSRLIISGKSVCGIKKHRHGSQSDRINFLNLRLCGVNTTEINYCAMLIYMEIQKLFPELSKYFTPDCAQPCMGHCSQGKRIENCIFKGWSLEKMEARYAAVMGA